MEHAVERDLIYDLGMHDGQDTEFYLKKGFRVVALEANPALVSFARKRFADAIATGQLIIVDRAVITNSKTLNFYVNLKTSKWSSIHLHWGKRGGKGFEKITVQGVTIQEIAAEHGVPDYMKVDIEGADGTALDQVARLDLLPAFVSVEGGWPKHLNAFKAMGYDRFALINQATVPNIGQIKPPLEGQAADHAYPMGASGPFGREAAVTWMTFDEIMANREAFKALMQKISDDAGGDQAKILAERQRRSIGWYDVHATTQS